MHIPHFSFPIADKLDEIRSHLLLHNRLILQAAPGAGKTTVVPLALLNEPWLDNKKILMLEPRRLAARSAASRMSEMLGTTLGHEIGYHIRSEKCYTSQTRILVVTEGMLTRYLQNDPALESIALVIFDEYHERHIQSDLSLAFTLQTQELLREDLKLLVMSATLNIQGLEALLDNPPTVVSEGRSFPVSITFRNPQDPPIDRHTLVEELSYTILEAHQNDEGDILVFLPGEKEIRLLHTQLSDALKSTETAILPLYGNLTKDEQQYAIRPAPNRKIVLATNIAETSLTIEGIRIVIDSGLERVLKFDPSSGMERLVTQKISKSSAIQRSGRAGRLSEGKCYRLWNQMQHQSLSAHRDAEILMCDLTPLRLELAQWGADAEELRWIDPPPPASLRNAEQLLSSMGALKADVITSHGTRLITAGLHPRLSHMIELCVPLNLQYEALMLAALLSESDILPPENRHSDLGERFWLLSQALTKNANSYAMAPLKTLKELSSRLNIPFNRNISTQFSLGLILSFAYPDRIAKAKGDGRYISSGGKEFFFPQNDPMTHHEWLVIARSDGNSTRSKIHLCSSISYEELLFHHATLFRKESSIEWNTQTERVESRELMWFGSIMLHSKPLESQDRNMIQTKLLQGIREKGLASLDWDDNVKALQYRLAAFSSAHADEYPYDYSDNDLIEKLEDWLQPYLQSESSLVQCRQLDWHTILLATLSWDDQQRFQNTFPSHFTAPTGTKAMIDYTDPSSPAISIRIQEMFGIGTHPSLQDGKIPLTVHLLSPARRPIQITKDLPRFWAGTYADVKKELKGRYPKHYWPDNPLEAEATKNIKKYLNK